MPSSNCFRNITIQTYRTCCTAAITAAATLALAMAFAMAAPGACRAASKKALYNGWMQLPADSLLKMGTYNARNGTSPDTALICYTIVANRYDKKLSLKEKMLCAQAHTKMWTVYFYHYYDYRKCFEHLSKALEISEDAGVFIPATFLGLGCMYQTISEETNFNEELGRKALHYYSRAFDVARGLNDHENMDMAFTNVVSMAYTLKCTDSIAAAWNIYRLLPDTNRTSVLRRYNKLLHNATNKAAEGDAEAAMKIIDSQIAMIENTEYSRLVYFTYVLKARLMAENGNFGGALQCMGRPELIATSYDMKDCMLEVYDLMSRYNMEVGNKQLYDKYHEKYISLKDTLTNYHQLASVKEMESQLQLKKMDEQMADMKTKRKVQDTVFAAVVVILAVVLAFAIVLIRQNKRLRRSYRTLYRKNEEMMKVEREERNMRKKYERSSLNDTDKTKLMERIMDVMENSGDIFSPDFSVERLAALTHSKYKYVSQIINEMKDCNFNTFLNEFRIKEACKRISDSDTYGRLTIEAISAEVGFKSRSTFVAQFKHITGLTPSEYQRQAIINKAE